MKISEIIGAFNNIAAIQGDVIVDNYGGISQVVEGVYRIQTVNIKPAEQEIAIQSEEKSPDKELDKSIKVERSGKGKDK